MLSFCCIHFFVFLNGYQFLTNIILCTLVLIDFNGPVIDIPETSQRKIVASKAIIWSKEIITKHPLNTNNYPKLNKNDSTFYLIMIIL